MNIKLNLNNLNISAQLILKIHLVLFPLHCGPWLVLTLPPFALCRQQSWFEPCRSWRTPPPATPCSVSASRPFLRRCRTRHSFTESQVDSLTSLDPVSTYRMLLIWHKHAFTALFNSWLNLNVFLCVSDDLTCQVFQQTEKRPQSLWNHQMTRSWRILPWFWSWGFNLATQMLSVSG